MYKNNLKNGFTLIELMVFFIFISLILAAATPIITNRVKNIPLKMNHGKFICYGNGRYEYYNSSRLVSSDMGCKFNPPKRAALYKIELIGAGAGGYNHIVRPNEYMETQDYSFELSQANYACNVSGKGVTCPPDALLRALLKGARFTYAIATTSATSGKYVIDSYTPIKQPTITSGVDCWSPKSYTCTKTHKVKKDTGNRDVNGNIIYEEVEEEYQTVCYTTQEEDKATDMYKCSTVNADLSSVASSIFLTPACHNLDWCYNIANEYFISPYKSHPYIIKYNAKISSFGEPGQHDVYGFGSSGGSGTGLYLTGFIDFCNHTGIRGNACPNGNLQDSRYVVDSEVRDYLSRLFTSYYTSGTVSSAGSCDGWGFKSMKPHNYSYPAGVSHGTSGSDVLHYNAIKAWGACTTNGRTQNDLPTGGQGGWIDIDWTGHKISGTLIDETPIRGRNAAAVSSGIVNGPYYVRVGNATTSIPSVSVHTEINSRHHSVGNGGGSAAVPTVRYVTSLDKDCVFNISGGGPAIDSSISESAIRSLEKSLNTTLTCNKGTLKLTAKGGKYDTGVLNKDYSGFANLTPKGEPRSLSPYVTVVNGGTSPYSPDTVFSKFVIKKSLGAGGRGNRITDNCVRPYGEYILKRLPDGYSINKAIDRVTCDESTQVSISPAESGSMGAIIISW